MSSSLRSNCSQFHRSKKSLPDGKRKRIGADRARVASPERPKLATSLGSTEAFITHHQNMHAATEDKRARSRGK
jgi:hypothetical protein